MSRVKEIREQNKEKKLLQEYNKRKELADLRDKHSPEYSNWRGNVTEGMNTSNVFFTTLPSTGETDLETIDTDTSASFEGAGGNDAFDNTTVRGSGSGSGSDGGFAIGSHLAFNGDGQPRFAILKPIDSSKFDTLTINAIRGNDTNGGEDPDASGEELRLYYLEPGGSAFRSISITPNGDQALGADSDVIIPLGSDDSGLIDYEIKLPSYARGAAFRYMLYQLSNSGTGFDNYGIKNVRYQRKSPISLFVPLDSPEAVSFINDGSGGLSPEEKKKRLEDMLAASDEYQSRQFPFNKAAYEKAAQDVARNIEISLDPNTFNLPAYGTPTYNQMFNTKITDSSSDEDLYRYLEQRGLSIDTLTKDNINRSFNNEEEKLQVINNSSIENRDKFLTAMGINVNDVKNLSNDTYRKLRDARVFIEPGGTPSTGWNGQFYSSNDPQLEVSRIVPTEIYLKAKEDPNWSGVERPDIVIPGTRYVLEKPYSFSPDSDARPTLTGPRNDTLKKESESARNNIHKGGVSGDVLGFRWDLNHFENGIGSGDQRLAPGTNFAREQVVRSMIGVVRHLYEKRDELAYQYAIDKDTDKTLKYDPAYYLLNDDKGVRALKIASESSARDLDYPRSAFGKDGDYAYRRHQRENDRTVALFQSALSTLKSMSTDFNTYENDEWYIDTSLTGKISVGNPLKVHPYSGLPEPGDEIQEPQEPTEPTGPEKNYPPELNDIGGEAWELGNTITKQGFKKADGDFDIFAAGGGNAKMAQGFTYEQVMEIGRKNLNVVSIKNLDNKTDTKFQYKSGKLDPIGYSMENERIDHAIELSASLSTTLGLSILTGQSREIKLGDRGKADMIQSVDPNEFGSALKIGPAIRPTVDNAVNPTPGKKLNVFTGLWGAPGAVEVDYDPATDTLTFTSNKMLRKGEGDEYNDIGTVITRFGDIPTPTQSQITQKSAAIITQLYGAVGIKPPGGQSVEQFVPQLAKYFTNNQLANGLIGVATQLLDFTVQGSASNIVALRNLMTNAGLVPPSDMERTYGGYGHVYTQTSYTGSQIPQELRQIINRRMGKVDLGGGSLGNTLQDTDAATAATLAADDKKKKKKKVNENYEPKAKHNDKVAKITGRLKSVSDFLNHADVKPVFPKDPPPEMVQGRHPNWWDGEKVSNRFNKLDPISAKSMPKTGNPKIDSKVLKAIKKRK